MRSVVFVFLLLSASAYGQQAPMPAELKRTAECMLKAVTTVPGVSKPTLGTTTIAGVAWPYLEYRAAEGSHRDQPIRFTAHYSSDGSLAPADSSIVFTAMLSGVGSVDLHVTDVVMQRWRGQCGAIVLVVLA